MLPFDVQTTHTYTLTATWPASDDDYKLSEEIDLITVTVIATQVD